MIDNEENSYFKNVVKDAIRDLKHKKIAFVFFEEQLNAVLNIMGKDNVEFTFDGDFYSIKNKKNTKERG